MKYPHKALDLNKALSNNFDMTSRELQILNDIVKITGFIPEKNIWRSTYWGKNLGASHWLGVYEAKQAVLKIQGVKPDTSEIYMINEFSKQNKSNLISPPLIYTKIGWSDKKEYEAIITEYISGKKVINDGKIATREDIARFLNYYKEYRKNCIPVKPWLSKSETNNDLQKVLDDRIASSIKAFPESKLRSEDDFDLAKKAFAILSNLYKGEGLEFVHGHFSCKDLIFRNENSDHVVLFSNLFWRWRHPYFDAVFAYHWFMNELTNVENITKEQVDEQRKLWISEIHKATGADTSAETRTLVDAALLERAVAGFIIDCFLCDPEKPISKYLYESTKMEAKRLIKELGGI